MHMRQQHLFNCQWWSSHKYVAMHSHEHTTPIRPTPENHKPPPHPLPPPITYSTSLSIVFSPSGIHLSDNMQCMLNTFASCFYTIHSLSAVYIEWASTRLLVRSVLRAALLFPVPASVCRSIGPECTRCWCVCQLQSGVVYVCESMGRGVIVLYRVGDLVRGGEPHASQSVANGVES